MPAPSAPPELHWECQAQPVRLSPTGAWTLAHYPRLQALVSARNDTTPDPHTLQSQQIELDRITELDTAGAERLAELLGPALERHLNNADCSLPAARKALLLTVMAARATLEPDAIPAPRSTLHELLERAGSGTVNVGTKTIDLLRFTGLTLEALARNAFRPRSWRITSLVAQIEECALNAVPIIALLTFMVGAVIAFLGATILAGFGASIYTVNLVTFSFLREFAVLLTAILVAGRTASAFTAQLGSMKVNEEIDALRMLGLNPVELLVLPRVLALIVAVPILTFIGMLSGILGGALICIVSLDITPTMFMSIFQDRIPLRHFLIGMAKAPLFAFVIAVIGCLEGFKVSGSAQSVGQHTTSAVVQSIFVVILLDALAALFFMEMGW